MWGVRLTLGNTAIYAYTNLRKVFELLLL